MSSAASLGTSKNRRFLEENEEIPQETPENALESAEFTEEELCANLCRSSLFDFVREFWSTVIDEEPVWNWHIEWLCNKLQKIAERVFRGEKLQADTTINIPPGMTKTTLLCVMLPAWIWTRMPAARIASVSYAHDQAAIASLLARDLITSDKYQRLFPEIKLRDDTNAKAHYANTLKGYRFACGIDGQILGKHFHFILVDDPLNPEQAASEAELKIVNRFMERTLPSRKVNKKVTPIILLMQRLAEHDPSGVRLERAANGMPHDWVCYDGDTEILTPDGWVPFSELQDGTPVAQVDPIDLSMSFVVPTAYFRKNYEGDVLRTESKRLDMLVTPDHRVLMQTPGGYKKGTGSWTFKRASEYSAVKCPQLGWLVPQTIKWEGAETPKVKIGEGAASVVWDGDDFAKFMGVWLAEGWHTYVHGQVCLSQDEGEFADEIGELLDRCPFTFRKHKVKKNKQVQWCAKGTKANALYQYAKAFGKSRDKFVPKSIKGMSVRQIRLFLEWFARGDGHKRRNGNITYTTVSKRLADDLQELIIRTGRASVVRYDRHNDCYRVHERGSKTGTFDTVGRVNEDTTSWQPFSGRVYCVNVPKSAVLVRRNGKAFVSGNCFPAYLTDDVNPPECRAYYVDGLLDPNRLDDETLNRIQQEQGDYVLAGQYLQRPIPEGLAMFHVDKINVADTLPEGVQIVKVVRFWDRAATEGAGAFTVGVKMGMDQSDHVWILHVERARLDSSRRERLIKNTAAKDGKAVWIGIEQEPGSGGKHSAQVTVKNLMGYRCTPVPVGKADGDKVARAYGLSTQINNGNCSMLKGEWNVAFINELRYFPFSKFKDQVDASSGAFNLLSGKRRLLGGGAILRNAKR